MSRCRKTHSQGFFFKLSNEFLTNIKQCKNDFKTRLTMESYAFCLGNTLGYYFINSFNLLLIYCWKIILQVKRHIVSEKYAAQIDEMYQHEEITSMWWPNIFKYIRDVPTWGDFIHVVIKYEKPNISYRDFEDSIKIYMDEICSLLGEKYHH